MPPINDLASSKTVKQSLAYGLVGVVNTLTDFCIFALLLYVFEQHLITANSVAFSIAVLQSYFLNNVWTFKNSSQKVEHRRQFLLFLLVQIGALVLSNSTIVLLSQYTHPMISKLGATIIAFIWGFVLCKRFVFRV